MRSIFIDKDNEPTISMLQKALGNATPFWKQLEVFALKQNNKASGKWHFSGSKFGWSYRISDNKRVIIYLLPRDQYFKAAFVFSNKAVETIFNDKFPEEIKQMLHEAKPYAEGRGIRVEVRDENMVNVCKKLVRVKVTSKM